ncbi:hypothetical protein FNF28_06465 [Cafeteria roenbergensis]|uniref:Uncharacterized protein n=1 Tax=Cafeteria roenbergensis TaxID=33653 RepID=A0A5A8CYU7_CAFRO|nr:hypothetical protein FNF28_06465 [Cafeteria roenbergensis]
MSRPDKASWDASRREEDAVLAMRDGAHLRGRGVLGRLTEASLRATALDTSVRDAAKAESMALDALEARPSYAPAQWVLASCTAQLAAEGRATASEGRDAFAKAVDAFGGEAEAPASLLLEAGTFLRVRCGERGDAERVLEAAVAACAGTGWRGWAPHGCPIDRDHPLAVVLGEALAQLALVAHTGSSGSGSGGSGSSSGPSGGVLCQADAERLYKHSLSLHPFNAVALTNLGLFTADVLRRPRDAEKLHRRAVAVDPANAPALYNLGALLGEHGEDGHQEAMELYRRAVEAQPDHAFALFNLAVGLEEEGDLEGARTNYALATVCSPTDALMRADYASFLWWKVREGPDAEAEFRSALEAGPDNVAVLRQWLRFADDDEAVAEVTRCCGTKARDAMAMAAADARAKLAALGEQAA